MGSRPTLDEVRQQIDAGKKSEARRTLSSLLLRDSKNAEAWWLYAQVAEDKTQLYGILTALADNDMPSNPYQPRARAMLAKMPYQTVTGKPKLANRGTSLTQALLFMIAVVVVLVVGVGGLVITSRLTNIFASTGYGSQSQAANQDQTDPRRPIQVVVVTVPVRLTSTPMATITPKPSSTPRPTSTPRVDTPTTTAASKVALADAVPALHDAFSAKVDGLLTLADTITSQLNDADKFSSDAVQTTLDQVSQIQQLRNKVVTTNLSSVPVEISQQYIIPAQSAYLDYANSFLYWIDLQMEALRLYKGLETTPSNELKTAQKLWADQKQLAAKQATIVATKRDTLKSAFVDYSIGTAQITLLAKVSNNALIATSKSNTSLKISAGAYRVYYFIQAADNAAPEKIALGLSQIENTTSAVSLVNGSKQKLSDTLIVTIPGGTYKAKADSASWWVLVIDPAS